MTVMNFSIPRTIIYGEGSLAKLADLIWNIILTLVLLGVLYGIGSLIWKAV